MSLNGPTLCALIGLLALKLSGALSATSGGKRDLRYLEAYLHDHGSQDPVENAAVLERASELLLAKLADTKFEPEEPAAEFELGPGEPATLLRFPAPRSLLVKLRRLNYIARNANSNSADCNPSARAVHSQLLDDLEWPNFWLEAPAADERLRGYVRHFIRKYYARCPMRLYEHLTAALQAHGPPLPAKVELLFEYVERNFMAKNEPIFVLPELDDKRLGRALSEFSDRELTLTNGAQEPAGVEQQQQQRAALASMLLPLCKRLTQAIGPAIGLFEEAERTRGRPIVFGVGQQMLRWKFRYHVCGRLLESEQR